jgi:hypothetical protein
MTSAKASTKITALVLIAPPAFTLTPVQNVIHLQQVQ